MSVLGTAMIAIARDAVIGLKQEPSDHNTMLMLGEMCARLAPAVSPGFLRFPIHEPAIPAKHSLPENEGKAIT